MRQPESGTVFVGTLPLQALEFLSMRLSVFSDYSLRVLMYAALKEDFFQVDEVTSAYGISRHHIAKVVHTLSRLGYLETRRGRGGGIRLARNPEEIRIGRLVRETEGGVPLVECFDPKRNLCLVDGCCHLKGILAQARTAFFAALDQHTLGDLVAGGHRSKLKRILLPDKILGDTVPK